MLTWFGWGGVLNRNCSPFLPSCVDESFSVIVIYGYYIVFGSFQIVLIFLIFSVILTSFFGSNDFLFNRFVVFSNLDLTFGRRTRSSFGIVFFTFYMIFR